MGLQICSLKPHVFKNHLCLPLFAIKCLGNLIPQYSTSDRRSLCLDGTSARGGDPHSLLLQNKGSDASWDDHSEMSFITKGADGCPTYSQTAGLV